MDIQSSYPNLARFVLSGQIWIRPDFLSYAGLDIFDFLHSSVSCLLERVGQL